MTDRYGKIIEVGDAVLNFYTNKIGKVARIWNTGQIQVQEKSNVINTHDNGKSLVRLGASK